MSSLSASSAADVSEPFREDYDVRMTRQGEDTAIILVLLLLGPKIFYNSLISVNTLSIKDIHAFIYTVNRVLNSDPVNANAMYHGILIYW